MRKTLTDKGVAALKPRPGNAAERLCLREPRITGEAAKRPNSGID